MTGVRLLSGDCLVELAKLAAAGERFHACVTDPPYGLEFMGKQWDGADGFRRSLNEADAGRDSAFGRLSRRAPEYRATGVYQEWCEAWARAVYDVLLPGAYLVAFGGTRTSHRMVCAIEDAGFEIRDTICWLYGSGFPKSLDVARAIDKAAGVDRQDKWQGWGTALKPAYEPIVLARKPLGEKTVAANVLAHGAGAINVNACRVELGGDYKSKANGRPSQTGLPDNHDADSANQASTVGRFPANVVHDGSNEVLAAFPDAAGALAFVGEKHGKRNSVSCYGNYRTRYDTAPRVEADKSSARFFYCAKANKEDRAGSKHPTVKPVDLIRWLVTLTCPPGGQVLDCFAGSGTTGEACALAGFDCTLIEREAQYVQDIQHRIKRWSGLDAPLFEAVSD